jgi:transcriptional regulator of arginine metabolism
MFMHNGCNFMHPRRETLRRIIARSPVGRQEELVRLLGKAGFPATQSSVSRDLRELGVAKRGDRYVLPEESAPVLDDFSTVSRFVRGIRPAGPNLIVVRTTAGAAQSVAIVLDRADWPEAAGTLSGDDTIFVATANAAAQRRLLARLHDKLRA